MSAKFNRRLFVSDELTEKLLKKLYEEHKFSYSLSLRMGLQALARELVTVVPAERSNPDDLSDLKDIP